MKTIKIFCMVMMAFIFYRCQFQDPEIKRNDIIFKINKIKEKNSLTKVIEDTSIADAIEKLKREKLFGTNHKDSIRKALRRFGIYDYNFSIINTEVSKIDELDKVFSMIDSTILKPHNRFDVSVSKRGGKYKIYGFVTENYVQIEKHTYSIFYPASVEPLPSKSRTEICGYSIIPELFYSVDEGITRKPLKFEKNNKFYINYVWVDKCKIYFYDGSGKIVSLYTHNN